MKGSLSMSFNPHPAFRPGDAGHTTRRWKRTQEVSIRTRPFGRVMRDVLDVGLRPQQVSIRTRPFGRVMQGGRSNENGTGNVSIRTRPFGRVMPRYINPVTRQDTVSIRTRPFGRVMPPVRVTISPTFQFQSAPGLSAG